MAFKLERFDIVKQYYDNTGLFVYHDTEGTAGKEGNTLAQITTDKFFNPVVEELLGKGSIIMITATDGMAFVRVTQLYDNDGKPEVKVTAMTADTKVGDTSTLTTAADSIVAAINALDARVTTLEG